MEATVKTLTAFNNPGTTINPDVYKMQLCNAITAALPDQEVRRYLSDGPYSTSVQVRENMGRADTLGMLAAAAAIGNEDALLFYIDKVQDPYASSELYGTPLLAAAVNGHTPCAIILHERLKSESPNFALLREYLWSTIEMCMASRRDAMLATLLTWYYRLHRRGSSVDSTKKEVMAWAIETGNAEALRICYSPIVNEQHNRADCLSALSKACKHGHANIVRFFLFEAAPPRCRHWTASQRMSIGLQVAATHNWLVAAKLLLDNGADVNYEGLDWNTAVICAINAKHVDMVVLLLKYGAQVPLERLRGKERGRWQECTALHAARVQGGSMTKVVEQAVMQQAAERRKQG